MTEHELRNYIAVLGPHDLHNYHFWGAATKEGFAALLIDNALRGLDFYERYVTFVIQEHLNDLRPNAAIRHTHAFQSNHQVLQSSLTISRGVPYVIFVSPLSLRIFMELGFAICTVRPTLRANRKRKPRKSTVRIAGIVANTKP